MNMNINDDAILDSERLSIADLERTNAREIWVLNSSHGNSCGAVAFQCASDSGPVHIEVPFTFVAINLADQASPEILLRSESFRRAVSRNFLTIISPERAALQNSSPSASDELAKIRSGVSVGVAESINTITGGADIRKNQQYQANLGNTQVHTQQAGLDSNAHDPKLVVDSRILGIMNNLDLSGSEKVAALRTHKSSIKLVDAYYISSVGTINDEEEVIEAATTMVRALKKRAEKSEENPEKFIKDSRRMAQKTLRS